MWRGEVADLTHAAGRAIGTWMALVEHGPFGWVEDLAKCAGTIVGVSMPASWHSSVHEVCPRLFAVILRTGSASSSACGLTRTLDRSGPC